MHQAYSWLIMFIVGCVIYTIPNEIALSYKLDFDGQRLAYAFWMSGLGLACLGLGMMHYHILKVLGKENQHLTSGFFNIIHEGILIFKHLKCRCDDSLLKVHKRKHQL